MYMTQQKFEINNIFSPQPTYASNFYTVNFFLPRKKKECLIFTPSTLKKKKSLLKKKQVKHAPVLFLKQILYRKSRR